jgi:hypothetical protein
MAQTKLDQGRKCVMRACEKKLDISQPCLGLQGALPSEISLRQREPKRFAALCGALALLFSVWSHTILADGAGNADVLNDIGCLEDEAGFGLNCGTAQDVRIASVTNIMIMDDGCAFQGDTVTFTADFEIELTADSRHDIGLWFATDGDPNDDGAISGTCSAATPAYAPDGPWLDLDGTDDDAAGSQQDTCGDIDADHAILHPQITLTAQCLDQDGDGRLDLPNCTSWKQPGSNDLCNSPDQAIPGAPSKCACDSSFSIGICVPGFCDDGNACTADVCTIVNNEAVCDNPPEPQGTICGDAPNGLCDVADICDGVGFCEPTYEPDTQVCRPGSGDACDPAEYCTGDSAECPSDFYEPPTTVCNAGSGDYCDPDEFCPGEPGSACPADTVMPSGSVCRAGSGDLCDPDETCSGVADDACPDDAFEPASTVCNPGSGDTCDPDEWCTGVPGDACPDDTFEPASTVCNEGSGDACDPDEMCPGVADVACPTDSYEPDTTVCRTGSGDLCDPDEMCPGAADQACPDDFVETSTTVCNPGSGDLCDPDETCTGSAGEACPDDTVMPQGTLCNPGSGDLCDPDEYCTGNADEACPDDRYDDGSTVCNDSLGACDPAELCPGSPDEACPDDEIAPQGAVCRESGTGDLICDPPELCDGVSVDCPPDDIIAPPDTPCGDQSTTECTNPDTCDGEGYCLPNNKVCGSVTNSALCEYDMAPTKGTCAGGSEDGGPCLITSTCVMAGGYCDVDTCIGGGEDGLSCTPNETGACEDGGGICEQSDQFRLLFSPDVKNWTAYRLNASNPGQTFYNIIYDATDVGGDDITLTVTVPYPYVTVGGSPLHIYDAAAVRSNGVGCLAPEGAIRSEPMFITLDDWIFGADGSNDYNLVCEPANLGPDGFGFCTFDVEILNAEIPESGLLYVNVHLDYGFKGQWVDANPYGPDSTGMFEDRYDRDDILSPWESSDALVNTSTDDGELALADCQAYWFSHDDGNDLGLCLGGSADGSSCVTTEFPSVCTDGGGSCEPFEDALENLNIFKKISGMFGRVSCSDDNSGLPYRLKLVHPSLGVVDTAKADAEGHYGFTWAHRGKPVGYTVELYSQGSTLMDTALVVLKGNGWWELNFSASNCALDEPTWESTLNYGSGIRTYKGRKIDLGR